MSAFDSNDPGDKKLWRLLGEIRPVAPSPYFARKVRRAIEEEAAARPAWWMIFLHRLAPAGVCAGLAVLAVVGIHKAPPFAPIASTEIEFETIENLDLLVSNYESSLWLDPSSSY